MTQIHIDTGEVQSVSSQFQNKVGELGSLTSQARSMMSNLQMNFRGQRANKIFNHWQELQPNLQHAIDTLQNASDLLRQAASDFMQVDSA